MHSGLSHPPRLIVASRATPTTYREGLTSCSRSILMIREEHTFSVLLMDVCGLIMYMVGVARETTERDRYRCRHDARPSWYVVGVARETTLDHGTLIFEPHF